MGAYEDTSWADLRALTRERRAERRSRPEPIRFSVAVSAEFSHAIPVTCATARRKTAAKSWRVRQFRHDKHCAYCFVRMSAVPRHGLPTPTCVTVDHKHPLILGGDDAPWNWALACWQCNNDKGQMTEAEFRALLAVRREAA